MAKVRIQKPEELAKQALNQKAFAGEWKAQLAQLAKTDPDKAAALKKIRIQRVFEAGKKVAASAKAQVPPSVAQAGAAVAETAGKAAKAGASTLGKAARLATGPVGGTVLGLMFPFGSKGLLSLPGKESRARDKAVEGFAALGATSSAAFLGEISRQQELAARRQTVLQTFEPEMFQQILMALADTGQKPNNLTATEQRIGATYEEELPARRPDKDVQFLLDQLLNEMSGQF